MFHYCYVLSLGGNEKSQVVAAASTTYTIHNLKESSAYKIQVSSMVGSREESPVLVTARTCESRQLGTVVCNSTNDEKKTMLSLSNNFYFIVNATTIVASFVSVDLPKVNGFAALNATDSSLVLNWTRVAGVSGYLLTWKHISGQRRTATKFRP